METTQIIGHSILPISYDDIFGEFPIEFYGKRKDSFGTIMYFEILSYRACDNGKHDTAECDQGNRTAIECHMLEDEKHDRHKDSNLRKSSSDKRPAQLIHPPENLKRKLLDSCKHEARRKDHTKRQSSDQIRIGGICRK